MTGDDMPKLTPQQRELVDRIFSGVTNRPPIEWTDYVRERCGTDVTVYDAVMTRLEELRRRETLASATVPSDPSPGEMDTRSLDMGKRFGQMIGRYRVLRLLGEGGMGSVFLAEQDRPKRSVALKVIRPGVVSATMLARFEQEAQVLGRLQHPGIAQIFDAGTADSGDGAQPYFVMEYVRGRSLLEYAEAYKVGTRQRMELIAKICDAVQHAHQKGVIHRDLKPGNILVTEDGQPKILDFGVARATDSDFQTTTLRTDIGQLIGTVPYMSPEQAAGDPSELDIRSDVYAMGVVGYELLAGRLPYDLKKKVIHEAVRVIREDDPTPLSSINRVFRGDVETIIRKALEKERMRRYQSASELAGDIRRYLADEPIVARPASVAYQLQKFAKRHRAIAGSAVVVTLTLIAATAVSAWWAVQATRSERVAEDALAAEKIALAAETDARKEAEAERAAASAASDFLVTSLAQVSPLVRGPTVTVAEVLKAGEGEIDTSFEDQPRARIELHTTYGRVYRGLNLYQRAEGHLRQALDLAKTHLPDDDPRQSRLMQSLGTVMFDLGRDREAVELIAEAESLGGLEDIVSIAETEMQWAFYLHNLGDYDMAEFYLRRALKKYESLDEGALGAATCLDHLGRLALDRGDLAAATELVRTAVTVRRQLEGEASIGHAYALLTLGYLEHASGRWAEAATVYRRARDTYTEKHDDDRKFMVQVAEMDLAGVLEDAAAAGVELPSDDAERDWTIERLDGIEWIAAISLRNRARVLHRLGHPGAGDDRFRRSVRVDQRIGVGDRAASIAHTRREWARLLAAADPDAAAEQYGLAMDAQREVSAEDAVSALVPTLIGLGRLHLASGAADVARPLVDEALALRRAHVGADDWPIGPVELVAAEQHAAAGEVDDARDLAAHALGILRRGLGANDARTQRAETVARELESG